MIFKIKQLGIMALILYVCVIAVLSINLKKQYTWASADAEVKPQVILDAGHGGLTNTID